MSTTTKKSTKSNVNTVSKKEYDELKKELEEMKKIISGQLAAGNEAQPTVNNITQYIGDSNKDVVVTSLTVGELNLATEGYGRGAVYTFTYLGEEQTIPYEDMKKIIKNNKSFIEGGNVFINDDELIKSQRLTTAYKKILSYEEMLDLFNKDRKAFEKIFNNMTLNQRETFKRIIFSKLEENEKSVDMNIVQVVNENMNVDIMEEFKNNKKMTELLTKKNDNDN